MEQQHMSFALPKKDMEQQHMNVAIPKKDLEQQHMDLASPGKDNEPLWKERVEIPLILHPGTTAIGVDRGTTLTKVVHITGDGGSGKKVIEMVTFINEKFSIEDLEHYVRNEILKCGDGEPNTEMLACAIGVDRMKVKRHLEHNLHVNVWAADETNSVAKCFEIFVRKLGKGFLKESDNAIPAPPLTDEESSDDILKFPCTLLTLGTAASSQKIEEDGSSDGSPKYLSRCGIYFDRVGRLLTKAKSSGELLNLARKGNAEELNRTVDEMMKGAGRDEELEDIKKLPFHLECLPFLKAKMDGDQSKEDVACALLHSVAEDINVFCQQTAEVNDTHNVFVNGSFLNDNDVLAKYITRLPHLPKGFKVRPHFLKYSGYLGAIGAPLILMEALSKFEPIYVEHIEIPVDIENNKTIMIGIDRGSFLTKIAYCIESTPASKKKFRLAAFQNEDFSLNDVIIYARMRIFKCEDKPEIEADLIKVGAIGVDAIKIKDIFKEKFGIDVKTPDEFKCLSKSFLKCVTNLGKDYINTPEDAFKIPLSLQEKDSDEFKFPCLVISLGSVPLCVKVEEDGKCNIATYSNRGGVFFANVGKLITGAKNYPELLDLARKGDATNINTCVEEILGENYHSLELDAAKKQPFKTECYAFGKMPKDGKAKKEDLARALLHTTAEDIIEFTLRSAEANKSHKVYFTGSMLHENEILIKYLSRLPYGRHKQNNFAIIPKFLKYCLFNGALGACLIAGEQFRLGDVYEAEDVAERVVCPMM